MSKTPGSFVQKLAFIGNIVFLACLIMQTMQTTSDQLIIAPMAIIGILMSPFLNISALIIFLFYKIRKESGVIVKADWIVILNILFLIFQIFHYLIL